jgi:hypothetical protein
MGVEGQAAFGLTTHPFNQAGAFQRIRRRQGYGGQEGAKAQRGKPQPNVRLEQGRPAKRREKGKKMEAKI